MDRASSSTGGLVVAHVIAPSHAGGAERVVQMLAIGRHRTGLPTHVVGVIDEGEADHPFFESLEAAGVPTTRIELAARAYIAEFRSVRDAIRAAGAAVVHTHGARSDVIAGRSARSAGVGLVSTSHGFIGLDPKGRVYEGLQIRSYRRGREVVAVSAAMRDRLLSRGVPTDRLSVIPNRLIPIEPASDRPSARRTLGLDPDATVLGWIGRLSHEKGPDVMIEAFRALSDDIRLSMIGDGAMIAELEEASADLGERVAWHGRIDNAARSLPAFDIVVLSSRTEGTPIVALEAMAAGTPVVATRVGGVPDLIEDGRTGLLVDPENPIGLADSIRRLLADRTFADTLANAARRTVSDEAGRAWLDQYEAVYERAVEG